jgi:hypothetical protein
LGRKLGDSDGIKHVEVVVRAVGLSMAEKESSGFVDGCVGELERALAGEPEMSHEELAQGVS